MTMPATAIQAGRGRGRDPWEIRGFLRGKGLFVTDVARLAQVPQQVAQETVKGTRNHHRVLEQLEKLGCPPALLYGGRDDMGRAA